MNEQMFNHPTRTTNKVGPFLPGLKAQGILGRFGDVLLYVVRRMLEPLNGEEGQEENEFS